MMKHPTICSVLILGLALLTSLSYSQTTRKFRSDDPLMADPDRLPLPKPEPVDLSQIYDFLENTFAHRPKKGEEITPAENVNTLGEVPDSSWFTNRMGPQLMTLEELVRGPDQVDGPDRSGPWLILGVKSEGVTPGFTIRDVRDDIYFIKFDPLKHPQLTTSTEVIATKFFYAFGYNVPENYLSFIRRQDLVISPDEGHCGLGCQIKRHQHPRAIFVDEEGKERLVTHADIDNIFQKVFQGADGRTPVIASRRLFGTPLGHFKYYGTRSDDPNDIFPHENRRELRGLRVFSAWLNHDDSRSINSLDMYVGEPEKGYVKHHLLDFGSCLGSGSIKVQSRRAGNEYMIEWGSTLKSALTLGIWDRPWRHVKYPEYPAVGRFEGDFFQPHLWRPEYPNPAFERMQMEDAFWAARIVMQFSDKMIRAVVRTGQILDAGAEEYVARTLIKRRDKIVRYYLAQVNPLDDFQLTGVKGASLRLEFENLGLKAGLAAASTYEYQWFRFDNELHSLESLGEVSSSKQPSFAAPDEQAAYLMVRIRTLSPEQPEWKKKVEVFIRNNSQRPTVVGIERES
ncbi:hypothetical protein MYX75_05775 [Acidobacteria bacterium AH-259-A15]|nr:hypothetical protein [Acidobacteria bacterium AH-259-A15]